ncbi:MAG: class I SAM-dependent methyltransferase [Candidatus Pacebacteria bacterium]|nr:class I SAM-dependent methyltransferase [Candidatus Paceibacterota bacterium]
MEKINLEQKIDFIIRDKYSGKPNRKLLADVKRLKSGEPLDYIIGWTPFLNCKIDLSQKPLIPRSETEFWTEAAVKEISAGKWPKKIKVLDIFSGSGCVGIAILKACPELVERVDFSETDPKLVKQIKINLKLNKISPKRYRIMRSDIFKNVRETYDFILANPPYVAGNRISRKVIKYEPKKALWGGKKGMEIIKNFLKQAPEHLRLGGHIYMEFSPEQKRAIAKLIKTLGRGWKETFHKDQSRRWRWVAVKRDQGLL